MESISQQQTQQLQQMQQQPQQISQHQQTPQQASSQQHQVRQHQSQQDLLSSGASSMFSSMRRWSTAWQTQQQQRSISKRRHSHHHAITADLWTTALSWCMTGRRTSAPLTSPMCSTSSQCGDQHSALPCGDQHSALPSFHHHHNGLPAICLTTV
eukprot:790931-Amphidinium_carterae.1